MNVIIIYILYSRLCIQIGNDFIYAFIVGKVFEVTFCPAPHNMPDA